MTHALTITFDEDSNNVSVAGVPQNKVIALGMLALASGMVAQMGEAPKPRSILTLPSGAGVAPPHS